eukprot:TRINITY_DN33124_c0_g1_i1.p1 TRINITY_DN33124_c0_g1~~TRINITY_DN33124_c0_g1_i1.p1  ORF type:complete len:269 (+),score=20.29 TRINITY_DN33124_c0_g1_i1:78-809(+)
MAFRISTCRLAAMKSMILYGHPISQPTRSCLLLASQCNSVDVEFKSVNILKGDHRRPPYTDILPLPQVPYLKDKDSAFGLFEAPAILLHLAAADSLAGGNAGLWYPPFTDTVFTSTMHQWMHWHHANTRLAGSKLMLPLLLKKVDATKWTDDAEYAKKVDKFAKGPLATLNKQLSKTEFLAGPRRSLADILILPEIDQLLWLKLIDVHADAPHVGRWVKTLSLMFPQYQQNAQTAKAFFQRLV